MKNENLIRAIGALDEDLILRAEKHSIDVVNRKPRNGYKTLLIAAIIGAAILAIAAAYYGIIDAFRGVLKEQNPAGEVAPISSMAPIVEKSGKLIEETISDNNIDVTVRGVVGSAEGFKILLDLVTRDDKPLAILQDDGSYSQGDLTFGTIIVTGETEANTRMLYNPYENYRAVNIDFGDRGGTVDMDLKTLEFKPTSNKATLLLSLNVSGNQTPLAGQTIKLELGNLIQQAYMPGTQIGMKAGDLQTLLNQFDPVFPDDFEVKSYYTNSDSNEIIPRLILAKSSGKHIPLADYFPDVMLTNMALHEDILYFRYVSPEDADLRKLIHNIGLVNQKTGEAAQIMMQGTLMPPSEDGMLDWYMSFKLPDSTQDINDYVFMVDFGEGYYPLVDGIWDFSILLDYENTTRVVELNEPITIRNVQPTATKLMISPYYLALSVEADDIESKELASLGDMKSLWEQEQKKAILIMKDGSVVEAGGSSGTGSFDGVAGEWRYNFTLNVVIDPEQVASFSYCDLTVSLISQP